MSSKRSPQTAAKRAREQAVREKRELKAEKKRAMTEARKLGEVPVDQPAEEAADTADADRLPED